MEQNTPNRPILPDEDLSNNTEASLTQQVPPSLPPPLKMRMSKRSAKRFNLRPKQRRAKRNAIKAAQVSAQILAESVAKDEAQYMAQRAAQSSAESSGQGSLQNLAGSSSSHASRHCTPRFSERPSLRSGHHDTAPSEITSGRNNMNTGPRASRRTGQIAHKKVHWGIASGSEQLSLDIIEPEADNPGQSSSEHEVTANSSEEEDENSSDIIEVSLPMRTRAMSSVEQGIEPDVRPRVGRRLLIVDGLKRAILTSMKSAYKCFTSSPRDET